MKLKSLFLLLCFSLPTLLFASAEGEGELSEEEYMVWAKGIWDSLDKQTGEIEVPGAPAALLISDKFYYLNPKDAEKVLVEVWGNPPGQDVLGMIFPAEGTPFDEDSWAVTIEYEADGYVSDEDAEDIDYSDLLKQMQADTKAASEERVLSGYEPISLVGWASQPYYDKDEHKLHWAKELKFGDMQENTLNYNIRILGREGVLVLNYVADMNQKAVIQENLSSVLALAEFDQGQTYADFDPEIDKVAAYGIGALITGKVLAKTGLFAAAILLLKKFWIFIALGVGALFKTLFSRKKG
ncbi:DUF2167 domain-containing protein [Microbulbifer sp. OS29]|uniref:DUF2167 domain-containing protein n=1 Tax=Microbulbifer okhotskensis TaxID=2926617 RepID=A0A9X2J8E4_9GAMM|nr:DUF2167 domain-containing protein [Microbulbifer okhotskensis]MCO1336780.1 DUF2167 domain-containing protein [Microbulbifer okhotskensis]